MQLAGSRASQDCFEVGALDAAPLGAVKHQGIAQLLDVPPYITINKNTQEGPARPPGRGELKNTWGYLINQKCWKIREKVADARHETAGILGVSQIGQRSRRCFLVEFDSAGDFSDAPLEICKKPDEKHKSTRVMKAASGSILMACNDTARGFVHAAQIPALVVVRYKTMSERENPFKKPWSARQTEKAVKRQSTLPHAFSR